MSNHQVVLVYDEHVPLAVDALWAVVVGESRVQPLALVPADGFLYEELGVLDGDDLGGMEATTPRAIRSTSAAVMPGSAGVTVEASASSARTISSTSVRDSLESPSPQATKNGRAKMARITAAKAFSFLLVMSASLVPPPV